MAQVKPLDQAAEKWSRRAAVAGSDYQRGVESPRRSWSAASRAAAANYRQAVTEAASQGRYEAGVVAAGDEGWSQAAVQKGPARFAEGVALAVGRWSARFQPYDAALRQLNLPNRGPTGSPANLQRVAAVATALRAVRQRAHT